MDRRSAITWTSFPWQGLVIGVLTGLLSGLLGIGGGVVIVPALIAMLAMEQKLAHGTSLAATLPVASASLVTYWVGDHVDWPVAGCLAAGAIFGALAGTHLLQIVPKRPLTMIFVAVILLTAIRLLVAEDAMGRETLSVIGAFALVAIGFVTGTLSGLVGIGGGVVMIPAMVVLFGVPPVVAKGTSVAVIVPSSLVGTIRNRTNRNADLRAAVAIGATGIPCAVIGGLIARSISDVVSNVLFAVLLVIVAIMQIRTLRSPDLEPVGDVPPVV